MKTILMICLFIILSKEAFTQDSHKASNSCLAPIVVTRKLWLYNSEGKIAGNQDSVISKEYFLSKWTHLQSDVQFNKAEKFYCVFEAKDVQPYAYYFNEAKLSNGVLQKIASWEKGGTLTFFVEEIKGAVRKVSCIRFVLK